MKKCFLWKRSRNRGLRMGAKWFLAWTEEDPRIEEKRHCAELCGVHIRRQASQRVPSSPPIWSESIPEHFLNANYKIWHYWKNWMKRTMIRNSMGPRPSLFVPERTFDLLVKPQIKNSWKLQVFDVSSWSAIIAQALEIFLSLHLSLLSECISGVATISSTACSANRGGIRNTTRTTRSVGLCTELDWELNSVH